MRATHTLKGNRHADKWLSQAGLAAVEPRRERRGRRLRFFLANTHTGVANREFARLAELPCHFGVQAGAGQVGNQPAIRNVTYSGDAPPLVSNERLAYRFRGSSAALT